MRGTAHRRLRAKHAGWLQLRVDGPAGTASGSATARCWPPMAPCTSSNLRTARANGRLHHAGRQRCFEPGSLPRFPLRRNLRLSGGPGPRCRHGLRRALRHAGRRTSSAPQRWLNQLYRNIDWGQRGNFLSVPTDCPQRDERLGWLGDAQIFARTAAYNRDVAAFFAKWLDDVADAQLPVGRFHRHRPRLRLRLGPGAGLGRRRRDRAVDHLQDVRGPGILRAALHAMTAWMDYLEPATRTTCGPATSATTTATGSPPATTTRPMSSSPPRTGPTTPP